MGHFIGGQHTFDQYNTLSGHHKCDSVRKYGLTAVESSQTCAVMDHEDPLPQVRSHRESEGVEKKQGGNKMGRKPLRTERVWYWLSPPNPYPIYLHRSM